jgi:hypothetical protein
LILPLPIQSMPVPVPIVTSSDLDNGLGAPDSTPPPSPPPRIARRSPSGERRSSPPRERPQLPLYRNRPLLVHRQAPRVLLNALNDQADNPEIPRTLPGDPIRHPPIENNWVRSQLDNLVIEHRFLSRQLTSMQQNVQGQLTVLRTLLQTVDHNLTNATSAAPRQ